MNVETIEDNENVSVIRKEAKDMEEMCLRFIETGWIITEQPKNLIIGGHSMVFSL